LSAATLTSQASPTTAPAWRTVPRTQLVQIDTLRIRGRDHAKGFISGALIGGAIGGAGVAILAYSITHSTGDRCNCGASVAGTIGVSALIGGAIGAVIGWPSWRQHSPQ
jgi:hypothetical protein